MVFRLTRCVLYCKHHKIVNISYQHYQKFMNGPNQKHGSVVDLQNTSGSAFDNSKPREERDFKEIYPDLDETRQLKVFVKDGENDEGNDICKRSSEPYKIDLKKPVFEVVSSIDKKVTKFSKQIADYGYQEPNKMKAKEMYETYLRPFSLPKHYNSIEEILHKKKNQVEYDMDEQDCLYLEHRNNNTKNIIKISPEIFEIVITILENEWDNLEKEMNSMNAEEDEHSDKLLTLDGGANFEKYGNDDGIVQGPFYEQRCAICNDSDCDNSNAIVFCDGCDIAVHQECYGVAFIPEGQWLCRKCMINKNREVDCVFCPSKTGAFKQLDNSLWSHVICALWINELYFANPIYMEPIEGIDLIPKSRWKLSCYICKQKSGACIQCTNRNCFHAYHVTCAKRAGLFMQLSKGVQGAIHNKNTLKSFCDRHGPSDWDRNEIIDGINKTRLYFRDIKILDDQNAKLSRNQKDANKLNIFKWKTENNTPIAPKLFSDRLYKALIDLKVDTQTVSQQPNSAMLKDLGNTPNRSRAVILEEIRNISNEFCRYWCLKRESKKGSPLIRKNDNLNSSSSILYGNNTVEEISNKIEFANVLLNDLDKVMALSKDNLDRQVFNKEYNQVNLNIINSMYFPINTLIEAAMSKLNKKTDPHKVILNYKPKTHWLCMSEMIEKVTHYDYRSISAWQKDIEEFNLVVIRENKPSFNIVKSFKKWLKEFYRILPDLLQSEKVISKDFQSGILKVPFVVGKETNVRFSSYDLSKVLKENDLSEVEDLGDDDVQLLNAYLYTN